MKNIKNEVIIKDKKDFNRQNGGRMAFQVEKTESKGTR